MPRCEIRFYAELNDFLPRAKRHRSFEVGVSPHQTVKDVVEAAGAPHTEVDLILVDGESVSFEHRLSGGERVSVYPVFEGLDISPVNRLRPRPLRDPCFVLDVHLGQLARNLRLLGFDATWGNDLEDAQLAGISASEHRILLTRDVALLKRSVVTHGYWVRSTDPDAQTIEVLGRFDLHGLARPFSRCPRCGGDLEPATKEQVAGSLEEGTRRSYDSFYRCRECGQPYWKGAHRQSLEERVRRWSKAGPRGGA